MSFFPSGDANLLIKNALKLASYVVCVFPKNICHNDVHTLQQQVNVQCTVEELHLNGRHKLTNLYFGRFK